MPRLKRRYVTDCLRLWICTFRQRHDQPWRWHLQETSYVLKGTTFILLSLVFKCGQNPSSDMYNLIQFHDLIYNLLLKINHQFIKLITSPIESKCSKYFKVIARTCQVLFPIILNGVRNTWLNIPWIVKERWSTFYI